MKLDKVLNNPGTTVVKETPLVKYDRDTQTIRFRFLEDFSDFEILNRHWVTDVGYVQCAKLMLPNKESGKMFLWDGYGKKDERGKKENKKPEYNCLFCTEKITASNAAQELADDAKLSNNQEGMKLAKQAGINAGNLHKKNQIFTVPVEYEVREKKKVVEPLKQGLLNVRINDLFSDKGVGSYGQLKGVHTMKDSLVDHWFFQDGKGSIMLDDPLKSGEKGLDHDLDVQFEENRTKDYDTGLKAYKNRKNTSSKATPQESYGEGEEVTLDFDDEILF